MMEAVDSAGSQKSPDTRYSPSVCTGAVALHTFHYNFCRIHQSLRVTPAMEAGLVDRVWNLDELVARLVAEEDAAELALGPRRTRSKGA